MSSFFCGHLNDQINQMTKQTKSVKHNPIWVKSWKYQKDFFSEYIRMLIYQEI